ncbi:MAG: DUF3800 domain-containing protein [Candidatus Omnitrophota bacterium]
MWFLYLDESGDLGFDLINKKASKFFTITILAISGKDKNRALIKATQKTLNRKLNSRKKRKRFVSELKGTETTLEVKKYLYNQIKKIHFGVYSITLNKKRVYQALFDHKDRVYNYIARLVLDQIPLEKAPERVYLIIDRSKSKPEINDFNHYVVDQLQGRLDPNVPLHIDHLDSTENKGLQVADVFSWGIFRKYEKKDETWYEIFKEKIRFDSLYLPGKKNERAF